MADVKVRKLPDWVVDALKAHAEQAGRSLEEELRSVLTEAAIAPRERAIAEAEAFREMLRRRYGTLPDSTAGIRADRGARG